ncbi:ABC transporter G family member 2 [Striga asiatica]|uniref:ABC transporter G family member 2 n=1 Tax=Striga asiatica TaxID=4170 RepID=A0A5A7NY68_STRAF|nr:ABC transporter G family member 2 [Striga asiatica]
MIPKTSTFISVQAARESGISRARDEFPVIRDLNLGHVARSRIIEISGSKSRRASIGIELVHDPGVLLVDEPTSGLDSSSALHVISLLQSADTAKTVVLTIHQPSSRIFDLLDNLILVLNGLAVHHGLLDLFESRLRLAGLIIPRPCLARV